MLVLSRRIGEEIIIGDNCRVIVASVDGHTVRLGIEAPREVVIRRKEIADRFEVWRHRAETARGRVCVP